MVPNQDETGKSENGQAGASELDLIQTLHHVLAKALLNGYQNQMALPITSDEVPRRLAAGVDRQETERNN